MSICDSFDKIIALKIDKADVLQEDQEMKALIEHEQGIWKSQVELCNEALSVVAKCNQTSSDAIKEPMVVSNSASKPTEVPGPTLAQRYGKFISTVMSLKKDINTGFIILRSYETKGAEDIKKSNLTSAMEWRALYTKLCTSVEVESVFTKLTVEAAVMAYFGASLPTQDIQAISADFAKLQELHSKVWPTIEPHVSDLLKISDSISRFTASQSEIKQWMKHQISTLNTLKDPNAVQQFITSLSNNMVTMETNLVILSELSESLLPNPRIDELLEEVIKLWFDLELLAFNKQSAILLQNHRDSDIETKCKNWSLFSIKFKEFLDAANNLLDMPTDEGSKSLTQPLLAKVNTLREEYPLQHMLCTHLSDFSLRQQCTQDQLNAIQKSIESPLTLLVQKLSGHRSYPQKLAYVDNLSKIINWVESKSQLGKLVKLITEVQSMRKLLQSGKLLKEQN